MTDIPIRAPQADPLVTPSNCTFLVLAIRSIQVAAGHNPASAVGGVVFTVEGN
jgi:hypothetical protein